MTIWTDDNLSSETTGFLKLLDIISPISVSETVSANSFCFNCFFPDTGGKCAAHLNPLCAFFSHQAVAAVVATVATVVRAVATVGTAAAATEVRAAPVVGGTKPHWQQRPIFHLSAASFPNF